MFAYNPDIITTISIIKLNDTITVINNNNNIIINNNNIIMIIIINIIIMIITNEVSPRAPSIFWFTDLQHWLKCNPFSIFNIINIFMIINININIIIITINIPITIIIDKNGIILQLYPPERKVYKSSQSEMR